MAHDEMIAVIQADKELKPIQIRKGHPQSAWVDCAVPVTSWNFDIYDFRIKPSPKLVPFTIEEWKGMVGRVVRHKTSKNVGIVGYVSYEVYVTECRWGNSGLLETSSEQMLIGFEFLDGTPCGKVVEE